MKLIVVDLQYLVFWFQNKPFSGPYFQQVVPSLGGTNGQGSYIAVVPKSAFTTKADYTSDAYRPWRGVNDGMCLT